MKITKVTLTGADDRVSPDDLTSLSKEYPFVEWGLLRSNSKEGMPRYPSKRWIKDFRDSPTLAWGNVALHLCGETSRKALSGSVLTIYNETFGFGRSPRIQLNGFSSYVLPDLLIASEYPTIEFIVQVQGVTALGRAHTLQKTHPNISILWDPSGGKGISSDPSEWSKVSKGIQKVGFAGGLGPDNIVQAAEAVTSDPREEEVWLDMESGVRTNDLLDITKCRQVLERVRPYVRAAQGATVRAR